MAVYLAMDSFKPGGILAAWQSRPRVAACPRSKILRDEWDKEEKEWTEIKIQGNATKMHLLDATTYTGSNSFRSNSMYGHIRSLYPAIHKRFFVGEESKQVLVSKD